MVSIFSGQKIMETNNKTIQVAVVGSAHSGKSALIEALRQEAAWTGKTIDFEEEHNLDNLHGHAYDV